MDKEIKALQNSIWKVINTYGSENGKWVAEYKKTF